MGRDILSEIRDRIVEAGYPAGTPLNEKQLAEEFDVSRTPIREALIRLESESLVASAQGRGFYVKDASIQECREITEIRVHLTGLIGRLATERATPETLNAFRTLLKDIKGGGDLGARKKLDARFHTLVDEATHNRSVVELQRRLANQFARIRNSLDPVCDDRHFAYLAEDVAAFLGGLESRDAEKCTQVLQTHLRRFVEQVFAPSW